MKLKHILFLIIGVIITTGVVIFGVSLTNSNKKTFSNDGYILSSGNSAEDEKSIKYNFSTNTQYNVSYDDGVSFNDVLNNAVRVPNNSFVHYNNQNISLLKKGVILDLDELANNNPKYYNLFEGDILNYSSGSYKIDNLGKTLTFNRFIVKTGIDKFLIVDNAIRLNIEANKDVAVKSNYVEVSFLDNEVIKIENEDISYLTIAEDAAIFLDDDIVLKLDNRYLYYNNEATINLSQIIIDNDDNIEIKPLDSNKYKEDEVAEEKSDKKGNSKTSSSTTNNTTTTKKSQGSITAANGTDSTGEEEVVEDEIVAPTANLVDIDVSANSFNATINISDPNGIISGEVVTTIIDNSTGKVIDTIITDAGDYSPEISNQYLSPNTTYSISTQVTYVKNDTTYTSEIVSQLFTTQDIGIVFEKNYYSTSSLAYTINTDNYSKVKSCVVKLYTTNGAQVSEKNITFDGDGKAQNVVFNELKHNTKYNVVIEDIVYDTAVLDESYNIELSAKTLKSKPTYGNLDCIIDKKNGKFTLQLKDIEDPDNGIESYHYEIYDIRDDNEPVAIYDKTSKGSIDIDVNKNENIKRNQTYYYVVVLDFYDNEKYYEYSTTKSQYFKMTGVQGPTMSFETDTVTFERITGTITIDDPYRTIDYSKDMTIQYVNSIGTTKSFKVSGATTIPFDADTLRASDTYIISVFATVDLQDDNDPISMYNVGSAAVQTNPTNPFDVSLTAYNESNDKFAVTMQLLNNEQKDNTLEALTLSKLHFSLYEGTTADGTPIAQATGRDAGDNYTSKLKEKYYDQSFIITPSFFNLKNADLKGSYYTIVVDEAYDYTINSYEDERIRLPYANKIPLNNNKITVEAKANSIDLPSNPADSISFEYVRNKDVYNDEHFSSHYNSNLEANTIVGVKFKAQFDNSKKTLRTITYHIFDNDTGNEYSNKSITYNVGSDGNIDYSYYWFEQGTSYDVVDSNLTRGHNFYISYTARLDMNYDGDADQDYPPADFNGKLTSKNIEVPKQSPKIITYVSSSTNNELNLKYILNDYDKTLYENKFLYYSSDAQQTNLTPIGSVNIEETDEYKVAKFTNLSAGYINVKYRYVEIKNKSADIIDANVDANTKDRDVLFQYFDSLYTPTAIKYSLDTDVNRLVIQIKDFNLSYEKYARIAALRLEFKCDGDTITKKYVNVDENGIAKVDFYDLFEFIGKNITVNAQAYYDDGLHGFDLGSQHFAIQEIKNQYGGGEYFFINSRNNISSFPYALRSIYTKNKNNNVYMMTNAINEAVFEILDEPTISGIKQEGSYILPKELNLTTLTADGSNTFTFDKLIPGISLVNEFDESTLDPSIESVSFKGTLSGLGDVSIKDSIIHIKVFETDASKTYLNLIKTINKTIDDFDETITIDGLQPGGDYAIRFTAEVKNADGTYDEVQLYDKNQNSDKVDYYFHTIDKVEIDNIRAYYNASTYTSKNIRLKYDLNVTMGFDGIRYIIYHRDSSGKYVKMNVNVPNTTPANFRNEMNVNIPCNPGSEFEFSNNGDFYRIDIIPFVTLSDGTIYDLNDEAKGYFVLKTLDKPFISVNKNIASNIVSESTTSMDFKVNVIDSKKVIPDHSYKIKILDDNGVDITPSVYNNVSYSIYERNKVFTIDNLIPKDKYHFYVMYSGDLLNNSIPESYEHVVDVVPVNPNYIDIGDVTATMNSTVSSRIDLNFFDSNKLTDIDSIRYSIYNTTNDSTIDGEIAFVPQSIIVGSNSYYRITLPDTLSYQDTYYIQIQFIKDDNVITNTTVEHIYSLS